MGNNVNLNVENCEVFRIVDSYTYNDAEQKGLRRVLQMMIGEKTKLWRVL